MNYKNNFLFPLIMLIALTACHRNPLKIDVSNIDLKVEIGRLDQDLFTVTSENASRSIPALQEKYGPFFGLYNKEILAIGDSRDSLYSGYLLTFITDSTITSCQVEIGLSLHGFSTLFQTNRIGIQALYLLLSRD